MKKYRRRETNHTSEYVIRRPLFWPIFLLIMCLCCLVLCFQDTASIETSYLIDEVDRLFYAIVGFSIWISITMVMFSILAIQLYFHIRFKVVIHGKGLAVTPLFGATYDLPYSSVEKVVHVGWSAKGSFIDIFYHNKKLHIPYTYNRHGRFKQEGFEVLLRKFESCNVPISEHLDMRENWGKKHFS
ncbi:hypothetical protein [Candidatus Enterococcus ferrettii]|uniref:Uncharacterized protein n=1 Tax=Candidatus Enterococcus ferrettii TaxID=2815324 RepID=A0ABV0ESF3_9ENTE|nr:hypothetical protein [Enterococcus sp. 665A]MBO1343025.1 hypothetical protein [Enterococcus sp. 665A]